MRGTTSMGLKVGTLCHYKEYDETLGNPCYAAMVIHNRNGIMTLEVTDYMGRKFIKHNMVLLPSPTTVLGAHEMTLCS